MKAVRVGYVFTLSLLIVIAGQFLLTHYYKPPTPPAIPQMPEYNYDDYNTPVYDDYNYITPPVGTTIPPVAPTMAIPPQDSSDQGTPVTQPIIVPDQQMLNSVQAVPVLGRVEKNIFTSQSGNVMWTGTTQGYSEDMDKYYEEMDNYDDKIKAYAKDEFIPYLKTLSMLAMVALALVTVLGIVLARIGFTTVGSAYALTGVWALVLLMPASLLISLNITASIIPQDQQIYTYLDPLIGGVAWTAAILSIVLTLAGIFLLESLNLKFPSHTHTPPDTPTVI